MCAQSRTTPRRTRRLRPPAPATRLRSRTLPRPPFLQDITISGSGIKKYYDPWRDAVNDQCDDVAPCVMTQVNQIFYFMSALLGLQSVAVQNIVIALAAAYVVLCIVTANVLVPLLAVLSIGATVTWVLATAFLVGFKFDSNVAILIVMVVGMAVGEYPPQPLQTPRRLATSAHLLKGLIKIRRPTHLTPSKPPLPLLLRTDCAR